jgi:hypothetical protein
MRYLDRMITRVMVSDKDVLTRGRASSYISQRSPLVAPGPDKKTRLRVTVNAAILPMVHNISMMADAHAIYLETQRHVCARSISSGIAGLVRAIQIVHLAQGFFGQL